MLYRITNPNILKNFKTITKSDEFYYSPKFMVDNNRIFVEFYSVENGRFVFVGTTVINID